MAVLEHSPMFTLGINSVCVVKLKMSAISIVWWRPYPKILDKAEKI
jgi:hypothetical protein